MIISKNYSFSFKLTLLKEYLSSETSKNEAF